MNIRRAADDSGTTAVEFALVALLILTIALAGVDFGLWMFQKSEASQAAREASRIAMLHPPSAPGAVTSGPIFDAATAQIEPNLPQLSVTVACANLSTGTADSACTPGQDSVTVTVHWHRDPLTFVGMTDNVTGASTRTVVGLP